MDNNLRSAVETALDNAEKLNPQLNAFLTVTRESALRRAAELANAQQSSPLVGVPIAVKDNICTKGLQTSCGSRILGDYRPQYNATVVNRLHDAGAVTIGKTNMDEFAMGSSNENSAFGAVKNPWNLERVPGGSSGGSAAAVAAGIVPVALGSDTGGSIRQPAAFCGVVGLKPTYGRVSRFGLVAFASSLDQIGVFARGARDIATTMQIIAGRDPLDATSADVSVPNYAEELTGDISKLKIGVPRELFGEGLNEEVREAVEAAIENYRNLGAGIVDVQLPNVRYCIAAYYIIATAEASSNLARFDGARYGLRAEEAANLREMYQKTRSEGFGAEVKRRIMLGTYVLSSGYYEAYYAKAQRVRTLIKNDFLRAFQDCDAVLTPTTPTVAFKINEKTDDPLAMYLNDVYTASANLAGIPGISHPVGLSGDGLPIGLQLVGKHWSESALLQLVDAYERAHPFTHQPQIRATET